MLAPTVEQRLPLLESSSPLGFERSLVRRREHFFGPLVELEDREPRWKRMLYLFLAVLLLSLFSWFHFSYWVPAHGGVDQNGYLVGGRMLAQHGSMRLDGTNPDTGKVDPFLFVGRMWVGADLGTDAQRFYPKYPIGLPALVAFALKLGGPIYGARLVYLINPTCMMLAMLAFFFLVRRVAGSFAGLLATAVLAVSPVTMALTTNPNSHASTLFFVTWGMFLLVKWWQGGIASRELGPVNTALTATLAGFLLGAAATVRYTEGLLILPLLVVALFNLRPRSLRSWLESGLLLAGWAIPVLILVCYNVKAMGTLTGYDPTNESTGFGIKFFATNWYTMLHQLNDTGLAFVVPVSVAGLLFMFFWSWRFATFISAWIFPSIAIYTFYYFAPDNGATSYMRFFLTIFPPLVLCAFWLLPRLARLPMGSIRSSRWVVVAFSLVGIVILLACTAMSTATHEEDASSIFPSFQYDISGLSADVFHLPLWWSMVAASVAWVALVIVLALICSRLDRGSVGGSDGGCVWGRSGVAAAIAAGAISASAIGLSMEPAVTSDEQDQQQRLTLRDNAEQVTATLARVNCTSTDAVIFSNEEQLLHHLQFLTQARLYDSRVFYETSLRNEMTRAPEADKPQFLDPRRVTDLTKRIDTMLEERLGESPDNLRGEKRATETQKLLTDERRLIVNKAFDHGRRVFIVAQGESPESIKREAEALGFDVTVLSSWHPLTVPLPRRERPTFGRPQRFRDFGGRGGERTAYMHMLELTKLTPKALPTIGATTGPVTTAPATSAASDEGGSVTTRGATARGATTRGATTAPSERRRRDRNQT